MKLILIVRWTERYFLDKKLVGTTLTLSATGGLDKKLLGTTLTLSATGGYSGV